MSNAQIQIPAPTTTYRELATNAPPVGIAPTFCLGPVGSRYLYSMAIIYDSMIDAAGYAVRDNLPHYAPVDAFPWIAQDRQVFQGPNEPQASYISRLVQWLDLWRHAGSSTAVMLAILAYAYPKTPKIESVHTSGDGKKSVWLSYAEGAVPFPAGRQDPYPPDIFVYPSPLGNWYWDGAVLPFYSQWMWWREWVIVFSPPADPQSPWVAPTKVWASGGSLNPIAVADPNYGSVWKNQSPASAGANTFSWGDGTCWGWAGTAQQAAGISTVTKQWKSAHTWVPWIIVCYDATYFQQTNPIAVKNPDGTWGYCGFLNNDANYGKVWKTGRPSCATCTMIAGPADTSGVLGAG